jgi:hypothetical protein
LEKGRKRKKQADIRSYLRKNDIKPLTKPGGSDGGQ